MFILASSPQPLLFSYLEETSIRLVHYGNRDWYEVMGGMQTYEEACKRAELYYYNFAAVAGIPLVAEERGQFGIFVDADGFSEASIAEHIDATKLCKSLSCFPIVPVGYALVDRSQYHYPLDVREDERIQDNDKPQFNYLATIAPHARTKLG